MEHSLWQQCLECLRDQISQESFSQWIIPLQIEEGANEIFLFAPNQYVLEGVKEQYLSIIENVLNSLNAGKPVRVSLTVGARRTLSGALGLSKTTVSMDQKSPNPDLPSSYLNANFTFDNFVEGKSNQLARAAAMQVAQNPGKAYNPLFLCGDSGVGKTHLMQAVGNFIVNHQRDRDRPTANVIYLHSERFVADMVKALQSNAIADFKKRYRSVDALLIDDIQFFSGKERSQEEFFHTFNALLEGQQQIILTSDRYPKELSGIEERLKSRFGAGLTIALQPPELETRVAILMNKAKQSGLELDPTVAFFIAKRIRANVRELEGALKRVMVNALFTGHEITIDFVQDALKDLLVLQERLVSIENIIKTVAEYYKIKVSELLSKRRNRSLARPRQLAMALCKELTNHSLPEIGDAFGGRDHTTVLHACRVIKRLVETQSDMAEDFSNLNRILST